MSRAHYPWSDTPWAKAWRIEYQGIRHKDRSSWNPGPFLGTPNGAHQHQHHRSAGSLERPSALQHPKSNMPPPPPPPASDAAAAAAAAFAAASLACSAAVKSCSPSRSGHCSKSVHVNHAHGRCGSKTGGSAHRLVRLHLVGKRRQ